MTAEPKPNRKLTRWHRWSRSVEVRDTGRCWMPACKLSCECACVHVYVDGGWYALSGCRYAWLQPVIYPRFNETQQFDLVALPLLAFHPFRWTLILETHTFRWGADSPFAWCNCKRNLFQFTSAQMKLWLIEINWNVNCGNKTFQMPSEGVNTGLMSLNKHNARDV